MHGGEEKEARPGAPRSENKIAFRVFTDDLLVIKQVIQEKPQNQYSRDQSTQAHIGISGEEKVSRCWGVHDQQRILVHLVQADLEDSQQEVEKNGDIFIKVYHGAGKTANQDNERLIQNIVVAYLAAHGGKAGICPELLGPGQKMIGHVLRNIVQTRNACQNGHTGNDQK